MAAMGWLAAVVGGGWAVQLLNKIEQENHEPPATQASCGGGRPAGQGAQSKYGSGMRCSAGPTNSKHDRPPARPTDPKNHFYFVSLSCPVQEAVAVVEALSQRGCAGVCRICCGAYGGVWRVWAWHGGRNCYRARRKCLAH